MHETLPISDISIAFTLEMCYILCAHKNGMTFRFRNAILNNFCKEVHRMKKLFVTLSCLALALAMVACGNKAPQGPAANLADGVYTAQLDDAATEASHGWRDTLTVTVKGGVITETTFKSYNADGVEKSDAADYPMTPAPAEWQPQLAENVKNAAADGKVAAVAGATNSSKNAQALFDAILSQGKPGETITVAVP